MAESADSKTGLAGVAAAAKQAPGRGLPPVHLWHPAAPSFARNNEGTANLAYFQSLADRPTFCADGLVKPATRPMIVPLAPATVRPVRRAA